MIATRTEDGTIYLLNSWQMHTEYKAIVNLQRSNGNVLTNVQGGPSFHRDPLSADAWFYGWKLTFRPSGKPSLPPEVFPG